ncbi:MAG: alpha/beta hydrolase [Thermoanaerobaculia bacterium]|nr:alpha/beta hydrolase [Thermoanaerobaculia bacterium]
MGVLLLSLAFWPVAAASASSDPNRVRTLDLEGAVLQVESRGAGRPTVVFEAGAGSDMTVWRAVADRVAPWASTFTYNRPGYGRSSSRRRPQSSRDLVDLLRRGLRAAGHEPPYLLVGHSLGGLYMSLFARLYPEEVVGVVLVDSSHPRQLELFRERTPVVHTILVASYEGGPAQRRYELDSIRGIRDEIESSGTFPPVPLVVITAGRGPAWEKGSSRALWMELQGDLTAMSPLGRQVVAERCKHFIQKCDPDLVARSISEVLAAIRSEPNAVGELEAVGEPR